MIRPNTTVIIETRGEGAADDYGNTQPTYTPAPPVGGYLEQTSGVEVTEGADTAVSDWLLLLPGGDIPIGHRDRVKENGRVFEVVGSPDVKKAPGRPGHHTEVRCRLVT